MSENFEFFQGTTTQNHAPRITVRRGGQLVLTWATVRLLGDDVTHVQIGFNAETRAVGIRPAPESGKGRYRLRRQKNGQSRLIDGKRFFRHHGLEFESARSFDAERFDNGIVGFHMPEETASAPAPAVESPVPAKKGGRRKSSASS